VDGNGVWEDVAKLSSELDIAPSALGNWKRYAEARATTAVPGSGKVYGHRLLVIIVAPGWRNVSAATGV
jgi:transposase-like protein